MVVTVEMLKDEFGHKAGDVVNVSESLAQFLIKRDWASFRISVRKAVQRAPRDKMERGVMVKEGNK